MKRRRQQLRAEHGIFHGQGLLDAAASVWNGGGAGWVACGLAGHQGAGLVGWVHFFLDSPSSVSSLSFDLLHLSFFSFQFFFLYLFSSSCCSNGLKKVTAVLELNLGLVMEVDL